MPTPQAHLARIRRSRLPMVEAVALLQQDTDLATQEDAAEWLENTLEKFPLLVMEPGRIDYVRTLEKAGDGAALQLWVERNKHHTIPFAARHVAAETGLTYVDAIEYLHDMIWGSLVRYDQNGEMLIILEPKIIPAEKWDDDTLLIHVGEFLRILNMGGIKHPSGWPEGLQPVPTPAASPAPDGPSYVGRPSVVAAILRELERRGDAQPRELLLTISQEAQFLETWAINNLDSDINPPTGRSMENAIRDTYRRYIPITQRAH